MSTELVVPLTQDELQTMPAYRRRMYSLLYSMAREKGVIDAFSRPGTLSEARNRLGYLPERDATFKNVLDVLAQTGALRTYFNERGVRVYVAISPPSYLTDPAAGESMTATGTMSDTHSFVPRLAFASLTNLQADIHFSKDFEQYWKSVLEAPFYARGRDMAADYIADPGGRVLDLASGQGHGLLRLANAVGAKGQVLGLELSGFHVDLSRTATRGYPQVEVRQGNLDEGLEFLDGHSWDGAMIIGAFHFLQRKEGLIRDVARALRPGGRFVIGNCWLEVDTFDRPWMDLTFGITNPEARAVPTRPDVLKALLNSYGFEVQFEYVIACYGWLFSQKR